MLARERIARIPILAGAAARNSRPDRKFGSSA
jgi:hypothetical protein